MSLHVTHCVFMRRIWGIHNGSQIAFGFETTSGTSRGGGGGSPFNDLDVVGLYGRTFPKSIILRCGGYIDAIQVTYETSNQTQGSVVTQAPRRGGTNTGPHQFDLLPGERIVKVDGRSGTYVTGLQFTTSTGNVTAYCGGSSDTPFTEQYSGYVLSYITGRYGNIHQENDFNELDLNGLQEELRKISEEITDLPDLSIETSSQTLINEITIPVSSSCRFFFGEVLKNVSSLKANTSLEDKKVIDSWSLTFTGITPACL
ncbi:hypothetical protein I4U23_005614 [Adineta vaga]|nr:hypothetical protein I4U23_005614 [Adineta vaga]